MAMGSVLERSLARSFCSIRSKASRCVSQQSAAALLRVPFFARSSYRLQFGRQHEFQCRFLFVVGIAGCRTPSVGP